MAEEDKATGDTAWTKFAPPGSMAERINQMPSANANVNQTTKGVMSGAGGSPKSTDGGMDLGMNATNSRGKHTNKEQTSPSATCMGMDRRKGKSY